MKYIILHSHLQKIVDSLYTSKLRYGLPLFGKIKWNQLETQEKWLTDLQLNQNKMLRFMNGSKLLDKISTESLLKKFNLLSVNQLNAQMKITEIYKALNIEHYPLKLKKVTAVNERSITRAVTKEKLVVDGNCILSQNTFINDATKAWNMIPDEIKMCKSLWSAKKAIKNFVKTLPI